MLQKTKIFDKKRVNNISAAHSLAYIIDNQDSINNSYLFIYH
jgi:hypothetical protein